MDKCKSCTEADKLEKKVESMRITHNGVSRYISDMAPVYIAMIEHLRDRRFHCTCKEDVK